MSARRHFACMALMAIAGFTAGCATTSQHSNETARTKTTLVVENHNWADMTVYLVRSGVRARIGSVHSFGRSSFVLPDALLSGSGNIRLLADPIGSTQRFLSDEIMVLPGQVVRLRVENNLALSSYSVF